MFIQQGPTLTPTSEVGEARFGISTALSSNGSTALIGGSEDNGTGAAWVFAHSGSIWTEQGSKLTGSGEEERSQFGHSTALSSDGSTALVGGFYNSEGTGAAWVFTRSGSTWTQQGGKLTGSGEIGKGDFGISVALSPDGNTALVGGLGDNGVGAVWVLTRSGATWTQARSSPALARSAKLTLDRVLPCRRTGTPP